MVGDARDLSGFEDASFDFVVAFELIEHLAEHDRVIDEIARVLAPRGVLVMSTPDRRTYAEDNPFHVRELGQEELVNLAERRFRSVSVFGQRTITGSLLTSVDGHEHETARTFFIERMGDEWRMADRISPLYLVMLASNAEMPAVPDYSTLGDCGLELVREQEPSVRELMALRAQTARDAESIAFLESELSAARHAFRLVEESVLWQIVQRVRGTLMAALGGPGSRPVRLLQGCLRLLGRAMRSSNSGGAQAPAGPGAAPSRSVRLPVPDEGQDHLRAGVNAPSGNDHHRRDGLAGARGEHLVHSAEIGARQLP
jgi:SAM-dependent methyltransferase